ncbi:hypothetical protein BJY52DRAFT_1290340 [Lactarius psammicola]|nr:hypothetical protein BJY52DRAFT_1290340 [Lactarius psammicola]
MSRVRRRSRVTCYDGSWMAWFIFLALLCSSNGRYIRCQRRALALTTAYGFMGVKSQGQIMEYVLIYLAKPPPGTLMASTRGRTISGSCETSTRNYLQYIRAKNHERRHQTCRVRTMHGGIRKLPSNPAPSTNN